MHQQPHKIMKDLIFRYPALEICEKDIDRAYNMLVSCYENNRTVLVAGNGGSGADAGHIVGELMKGFMLPRTLPEEMQNKFKEIHYEMGSKLGTHLQGALPAIDLTSHNSLITAFSNDVDADLIFAQQVLGYGKPGDIFWGISTSGNSKNVLYGICAAQAGEMCTIAMTGASGGKMKELADVTICVPATSTPLIQELHLPVYHALCAMVEAYFFGDL